MCVQIRRPNNYLTDVAQVLGPDTPNPIMQLDSLDLVKTVVQDTPYKLFIGGLPCDWDEEQASFSPMLSQLCMMIVVLAWREPRSCIMAFKIWPCS